MNKITNKNKKSNNMLLFITINIITIMVIGAAYAYFKAIGDTSKKIPIKIATSSVDNLMFTVADQQGNFQGTTGFTPLNLVLDQETFSETEANKIKGSVFATAKLKSSNTPNYNVSKNYNIYLNITENNFKYSTTTNKPEILLVVEKLFPSEETPVLLNTLPDGTPIVTVTDKDGDIIKGFDITTKTGLINIANMQEINARTNQDGNESETINPWKITIFFVNYNEEQNENIGKKFESNVIIGQDAISVQNIPEAIIINAPTRLSTGEAITNYTYKIKETASTGEYIKKGTQESNNYTYTGLNDSIDYNIKVYGKAGNKTETILNLKIPALFKEGTLAYHLAKETQLVTSGNGLYYHNDTLLNGAQDFNFRFSGGANNFVCFGSNETPCPQQNIFRIIGIFNGKIKLIKHTRIQKIWNSLEYSDDTNHYNQWEYTNAGNSYQADINSYLNGEWLSSFPLEYQNEIIPVQWQIGGMNYNDYINKAVPEVYQLELGPNKVNNKLSQPTKVGLMYVSDYLYAVSQENWTLYSLCDFDKTKDYRSIKNLNWLFDGYQYTISRSTNSRDDVYCIGGLGDVGKYKLNYERVVKPTFYLNSDVKYISGDGSQTNPFIIE